MVPPGCVTLSGRGSSPRPMCGVNIEGRMMLLDGLNHVAILTNDTDRLHSFYTEVFDATVQAVGAEVEPGLRMSIVHIGPHSELNLVQSSSRNMRM